MIVTDRFVFLHLHKSGGTFVNRFLLEFFPDARQVGYHLPRASLPARFANLPVLGTVRNPWEYYLSWHAFQSAMATPNVLFASASEHGRLDFNGTVRNLLLLADQPERLQALRERLPVQFPGRGINLTRDCLAPLAGSGLGFYSFMYRRMFGAGDRDTLIRTDELRTGLPPFLESLGLVVTPAMRNFLDSAPALNRSQHGHYSGYYDTPTRQLVAERDEALIAAHGFAFETAA